MPFRPAALFSGPVLPPAGSQGQTPVRGAQAASFVLPEGGTTGSAAPIPTGPPISFRHRLADADSMMADGPAATMEHPALARNPGPTETANSGAAREPSEGATAPRAAGAVQHMRLADADLAEVTGAPDPAGTDGQKVGHIDQFLWGKDGFSFSSLLRSLNPLQHIPIVSTIYQELTGDKIGAVAHAIGGTLIGGPIGLISSLANSLFDAGTGKDLGGHMMASLFGDESKPAPDGTAGDGAAATTVAQAPDSRLPDGATVLTDLPWLKGTSPSPENGGTIAAAGAPASTLPAGATAVTGLPWAGPSADGGPASPSAPTARLAKAAAPTSFVQSLMHSRPSAAAAAPASTSPVPAVAALGAAAHKDGSNAGHPAVPTDFSQRMMDALDKYRAAAKLHSTTPATVDIGG